MKITQVNASKYLKKNPFSLVVKCRLQNFTSETRVSCFELKLSEKYSC